MFYATHHVTFPIHDDHLAPDDLSNRAKFKDAAMNTSFNPPRILKNDGSCQYKL